MADIKIIKDLAYGYIEADKHVCSIIDTAAFQRLKQISQLSALHLYPSANHTRFEHSLGVMHIAMCVFKQLEHEMLDLYVEVNNVTKSENVVETLKLLKTSLKFASLLHDVGHAPLSHIGELFYDTKDIKNRIMKGSEDRGLNIDIKIFDTGSPHELMSCFIILEKFYNHLLSIDKNIKIEFVFRLITGAQYNNFERTVENVLISILNSQSFDVDKLDYLVRDNFMTGFPAPKIDIKRLIKSLSIETIGRTICYHSFGLSSLLSFIDSRDLMYYFVYNHHTTVYTDFLYQDCLKHFEKLRSLDLKRDEADKKNFKDKFDIKTFFSCDAISKKLVNDHHIYSLFFDIKSGIESSPEEYSARSKKLLKQLVERDFLKPAWKSLAGFKKFMNDAFGQSQPLQKRIIRDILDKKNKYISRIIEQIIEECKLSHGDVFIIRRSNKFYSLNEDVDFSVLFNDQSFDLKKIFPQRDFSKHFSKVSFYLFCDKEMRHVIVKKFIQIMKDESYKKQTK